MPPDLGEKAVVGSMVPLGGHPYSAQQIFQRLHEAGFDGGRTIVKDYGQRIRPHHQQAYLTLDFAPGETAQVVAYFNFAPKRNVRCTLLVTGHSLLTDARLVEKKC